MATVKVVEVVSRAKTILQDTTSVRWPVLELQGWLNDAYREISNLRPDANTQTGTFTCVAGARQVLTAGFASATRLIEVVRNVATTSNKGAVRLVNRRQLDDQRRTWYSETASVNIDHYVFDPRLPKEFLVYPPATTSAQLEVIYASVPTAHALSESQLNDPATAETIRLDDSYANVLLDYILYRAYSKDAEYTANANRAAAHYQAMQNALGVTAQTNAASQPGVA
jgi:hypothetical protein